MLTELTFCHKSSTNIWIDILYYNGFIQLGRPTFTVKHNGAPRCLQSRPHLGTHMPVFGCYTREAPVTQSATWVGSPLLDSSMLLLFRSTHYVSNNCIYVRSHLFAGTDSIAIDLMTMEEWLFSQHRPPAPCHQQSCYFFILAVVIAGDCTMTLAFHMLQKICRIKTSLQFISIFGRNATLSLEYLGPVAVFQWNINLREAEQTSSPNIAHSAWMHGTLWNAICTSLLG